MHLIFQRTGLPPDEFWQKPEGARSFMLASMMVQLEEEARQRKAADREIKKLRRR